MKTFSKTKKTVLIIAICIAALGITSGTSFALLTSRSNDMTNTFVVGSVETEVVEENFSLKSDTAVSKDPRVKNVGKNDCYIRARVNISPADEGFVIGALGSGWVAGDDGFYYYTEKVSPGNTTTPLFTELSIPSGWVSGGKATEKFKDFEVIVYQEAVQTQVESETGYTAIWAMYDAQNNSRTAE